MGEKRKSKGSLGIFFVFFPRNEWWSLLEWRWKENSLEVGGKETCTEREREREGPC